MRLTLLSHASLPLKYWDHAFTNAILLINRLPTTSLPTFISPFQALHHKEPSYSHFKTFECACYPHLRPFNKHKFQFRSSQCVNLGLSSSHKGYKCLTPKGKIIISKDVLFNEIHFRYPTLLAHPTTTHTTISTNTSLPIPTFNPILSQSSPATTTQQEHHTHPDTTVYPTTEAPPSIPEPVTTDTLPNNTDTAIPTNISQPLSYKTPPKTPHTLNPHLFHQPKSTL